MLYILFLIQIYHFLIIKKFDIIKIFFFENKIKINSKINIIVFIININCIKIT